MHAYLEYTLWSGGSLCASACHPMRNLLPCKGESALFHAAEKLDGVNNVMQENVSGNRVVKAYVREDYEKKRFSGANEELVNTQLRVLLLLSYMMPIMNIILNLSVVAVIKVGAIQVQAGTVTPGNVMAAITYISQILNAVMRMTMIFQSVSRGVASGKRVQEVLSCQPVICDGDFRERLLLGEKWNFAMCLLPTREWGRSGC